MKNFCAPNDCDCILPRRNPKRDLFRAIDTTEVDTLIRFDFSLEHQTLQLFASAARRRLTKSGISVISSRTSRPRPKQPICSITSPKSRVLLLKTPSSTTRSVTGDRQIRRNRRRHSLAITDTLLNARETYPTPPNA